MRVPLMSTKVYGACVRLCRGNTNDMTTINVQLEPKAIRKILLCRTLSIQLQSGLSPTHPCVSTIQANESGEPLSYIGTETNFSFLAKRE